VTLRLPPLNALRMFEAAGRRQNIRRAAAELFVTPSAVSRQVRALESWLGVSLFNHNGRSVRLTDAGARYLEAVTRHLAAISEATDEITGRYQRESSLRLRSYTLFATNWLVPRLTEFHRGHPLVELELITSSRADDFGNFDVDAEIRPGSGIWTGCRADLLVSGDVVVVCSPAYLEEHELTELDHIRKLDPEHLLRSIASPGLWQRWLESVGVTGVDPDRGLSFSDSSLTYHAALAGQGVCLAPRGLVETDLTSGRLVAPFPAVNVLGLEFYLVYSPEQLYRRAFHTFREWLIAALP
jgi:LysR family glycine cleavage system transcriptional activator